MKKKILLLLITFTFVLSFLILFNVNCFISLIAGLILFLVIIYILTNNKNDEKKHRKRWKLLVLIIAEMIFMFLQLLYTKNYSILNLSYVIAYNTIGIISFIIISRRTNFNFGILSFLSLSLMIPLLYYGGFTPFLSLIIVILFYSCISLSYEYLYGKRNLIKYIFISIFTILLINKSYIFLVPVLFLLVSLYRNIGKKDFAIIFMFNIIIMYIMYLVGNTYNINEMFLNNNIIYDSYLIEYSKSILLSELIVSSVLSFYYINKYNDIDYRLIIYLLLFINMLLVFDVDNISMIAPLSYLVSIYLIYQLFNINLKKNRVHIPYYKRYNKVKNIKKVSVVIPNYNYEKYIEERIDSVINQTYPIYELIVLDDKSSDNSVKVIEEKIKRIKNQNQNIDIKFIPNKVNSGNVFKQWEKAFEVATGDFLWIAEADDLCDKHFLNVVMQGFEDKDVILSYCESSAMDENGEIYKKDMRDWIDIFNTNKFNKDYINNGKKELEEVMCTNNTIANVSSVVFRMCKKIDVKKYLKEAQEYKLAGDWYFYSKVLLFGKMSYSCDSLNFHRIHKNSVTTTTDNFIRYKEITKIQKSIDFDIKLSKNAKQRISNYLEDFKKNFQISEDEIMYDKIELKNLLRKNNIKDDILLSIIIPVYNVEKYLKKCINSFIKTLPEKTEVIIINDGSPDNSETIIKEFLEKYDQIKYYKKENGGLSSVKNYGLRKAVGRYVIFLDSDDYVSSDMYSTMLKKAIDTNSDIVYSDVLVVYEDGHVYYSNMTNYNRKDKIMQILDTPLMAASWNKMVKRELYDDLFFPEGINNEDVAISPLLILKANKITKINSPFYKYFQRSGSIQNSDFNEKRFVIFDTSKMCFDAIKNENFIIQDKIIGSIVTHQLLGLLLFPIAETKDNDKRMKFIEMFCDKFNDLNIRISTNQYVFEYLKIFNYFDLIKDINEKNIIKIDEKIRK